MAAAIPALVGGIAELGLGFAAFEESSRSERRIQRAAEATARRLRERGREEAELRRREGRALQGRQRAIAGASGLTIDSFFDVLVDTAMREEEAAQRVAQRFFLQAEDVLRQASVSGAQVKSQGRRALLSGTTNFLVGTAQVGTAALKAEEGG